MGLKMVKLAHEGFAWYENYCIFIWKTSHDTQWVFRRYPLDITGKIKIKWQWAFWNKKFHLHTQFTLWRACELVPMVQKLCKFLLCCPISILVLKIQTDNYWVYKRTITRTNLTVLRGNQVRMEYLKFLCSQRVPICSPRVFPRVTHFFPYPLPRVLPCSPRLSQKERHFIITCKLL